MPSINIALLCVFLRVIKYLGEFRQVFPLLLSLIIFFPYFVRNILIFLDPNG